MEIINPQWLVVIALIVDCIIVGYCAWDIRKTRKRIKEENKKLFGGEDG